MYCVECGSQLDGDELFCTVCGAPVADMEYVGMQHEQGYPAQLGRNAMGALGDGGALANGASATGAANGSAPAKVTVANAPAAASPAAGAVASAGKAPVKAFAVIVAIVAALAVAGIAWAMTAGPLGGRSTSTSVIGSSDGYSDADLDALFGTPVGETVTFGTYEQDGDTSNGPEPLEWVVADKQGSRVQLVTSDLVECQPYASENSGFAWIYSDLRSWLNDDFMSAAFTDGERELIRDTIVAYPGQPYDLYSPTVTEPEWDETFLLDCVQADEIFATDADRVAMPSAYAQSQPGAPTEANWWLRDTGFERQGAAQVQETGEIDSYGVSVVENTAYVRPSLWIAMPASMVDDDDAEGRFGVYEDAVRSMSEESYYALADIDGDGAPELVIVSATWDDMSSWGVYLYGYEDGQAVYLGQGQLGSCTSVSLVMVPGTGLYVLGDGSPCTLLLITLVGGSCNVETVMQGARAGAESAAGLPGDALALMLYGCGDLSGLDVILQGWDPSSCGIAGAGFAGSNGASSADATDGANGGANGGSSADDASATNASSGLLLDEYRGKATEGLTSTVIDVNDTATRHDLNLFLSNFTEKSSTFTFDWNTCSNEEMCLFAIDHTRLNFPEAVEDASYAGVVNEAGQPCNERIAWDTFAKYPRVFLKKDFSESNVVGPCVYLDGYVYFPADGWHVPNGVAYVTSTTDIGDNRVLVTFDVYGDGVDYVVTDESYYTCSSEELQQKLGVSGISRTGNAIVERCDDGSVAPFKLWAFESN